MTKQPIQVTLAKLPDIMSQDVKTSKVTEKGLHADKEVTLKILLEY